jgi:hypothetical protein
LAALNGGQASFELSTLEPDGKAAACNAVPSGFDSHRRFFEAISSKVMLMLGAAARIAPVKRLAWRVPDMYSNEGIT